jgi:hypothetical protein
LGSVNREGRRVADEAPNLHGLENKLVQDLDALLPACPPDAAAQPVIGNLSTSQDRG